MGGPEGRGARCLGPLPGSHPRSPPPPPLWHRHGRGACQEAAAAPSSHRGPMGASVEGGAARLSPTLCQEPAGTAVPPPSPGKAVPSPPWPGHPLRTGVALGGGVQAAQPGWGQQQTPNPYIWGASPQAPSPIKTLPHSSLSQLLAPWGWHWDLCCPCPVPSPPKKTPSPPWAGATRRPVPQPQLCHTYIPIYSSGQKQLSMCPARCQRCGGGGTELGGGQGGRFDWRGCGCWCTLALGAGTALPVQRTGGGGV